MRVLQVIQFFSPKFGGSVVVPYELSKSLKERGHEVTIVTTDYQIDYDFVNSLVGVEVIPFRCQLNLAGFLISTSMKRYLNKNIPNFDLVLIHNFRNYQNILISKYCAKYNVPYFLYAHGTVLRIIEKKRLKHIFDTLFGYRILRNASRVIAVSNNEVNQYMEMHVPHDKIIVIPNGIDVKSFNNLPAKGDFRGKFGISEKHIVLFLGRLHERKGIDFLIKSFAELRSKLDDVVLVLAGADDGYKKRAEFLVSELKLTDIAKFIGHIDERTKLAAYVDSDVLVYPSKLEIFGLVPFEAIMCGTPVIVTDDCGCGEMVSKSNGGYTVAYNDIEKLSDLIIFIVTNRDIVSIKIDEGKEFISANLSWDIAAKHIEDLYRCIKH